MTSQTPPKTKIVAIDIITGKRFKEYCKKHKVIEIRFLSKIVNDFLDNEKQKEKVVYKIYE